MRYIDGFSIPVTTGNKAEALAFYKKSIGAEVTGLLTDKFGVPWMVNVTAPKA